MAYRIEKTENGNDIVIDGWENGIADDPYEGLADMRNINSLSTPKEAPVGFSTAAVTLPPVVNAAAFTAYPNTVVATVLVIGGGGGGGNYSAGSGGGGGGAGGVLTSSETLADGVGVSITVGIGGTAGVSGGDSMYASNPAATGGGHGGAPTVNGAGGGSGGGGGANGTTGGSRVVGEGNVGGNSAGGATGGAGGGGQSAVGANVAAGANGSKGGDGYTSSISGASVTYAGGGGGGEGDGGTVGAGGTGSTHAGGGGVGGGQGSNTGGTGQNGVVIISTPIGTIASATGGVHTTAGGNDIWTFTSSGTFTPTLNVYTPNTVTVSNTTNWTSGMAVIINSLSGGSPLSATAGSNTFYVLVQSPGVIKLYTDLKCQTVVTITTYGTGTLSTAQFGTPVAQTSGYTGGLTATGNTTPVFIIDNLGQAWVIGNGTRGYGLNILQFIGNTNSGAVAAAPNNGLGLCVWHGYLFLFIDAASPEIDYINLWSGTASTELFAATGGPNGNWHVQWAATGLALAASPVGHASIAATDDAMYICNGTSGVASLLQKAGQTFDPTSNATYTGNSSALALPYYDFPVSLAQLGTNLLVGGSLNYVYPWDRVSTSFSYPLIVAESFIKKIVSTNSAAYIFAGTRGRIYITNGSQISLFKKFPDQLANTESPYYAWGDALYFRNQLYFSISGTDNAGNAINNFAGVWAISLEMATNVGSVAYGSSAGPLKLLNSLSTGSYAGSVPVIVPMGNANAAGHALYLGWINGSGAGGIDYSISNPYTNYEAYIDSDMIPVGTFLNPMTNREVEYKLSKPLVTGETIRVAWRGDLTSSFTTVGTFTTTGQVADILPSVNFQKQQWVQLRVSMSSTTSSPSYNRLREVRIR